MQKADRCKFIANHGEISLHLSTVSYFRNEFVAPKFWCANDEIEEESYYF